MGNIWFKIIGGLVSIVLAVLQMVQRKKIEDATRLEEHVKETEKNEHEIATATEARQHAHDANSAIVTGSLPDDGFRRD
jgi:predicted nucleotidyltransferase